MTKPNRKRYSGKLLFQYRVMTSGVPGKFRLCEERIISFNATNAQEALKIAKTEGKAAQHSYKNENGRKVYFEFIGIMELLCLDPGCERNEVWYDTKRYMLPKERKGRFIPLERNLNAIKWDA